MRRCAWARCLFLGLGLLWSAGTTRAETIFQEDFETGDLKARGWIDLKDKAADGTVILGVVGAEEVKPVSGQGCLRIGYTVGSTGPWMHVQFPKEVREVYCRFYRLFPEGWRWPGGYGPHDTAVFAGPWHGAPTRAEFEILGDFDNNSNSFLRLYPGPSWKRKMVQNLSGGIDRVGHNVSEAQKVVLGKWHCVEYHCKLSAPGKSDGVVRMWVNGQLVSELTGMPLLEEKQAGFLFNRWMLGAYYHGGSPKVQHNYMDALVIATQYVGTLEQKGNQPPRARFSSTRDWNSMTAGFDASRSGDPEGEPLTYAWAFGDGQTGAGSKTRHTYAVAGDYVVRLTVRDRRGGENSRETRIGVGPAVGSGEGLKAEYWEGTEYRGNPAATTVARQVAFRRTGWGGRYLDSHVGDEQGTDCCSRWTGYVQPTRSEDYTLTYEVGERGRLWFDGKLIIDTVIGANEGWHATSVSVGQLEAGRKYPVVIEQSRSSYKTSKTYEWRAMLYWESASVPKEPVPTAQLYLPTDFAGP